MNENNVSDKYAKKSTVAVLLRIIIPLSLTFILFTLSVFIIFIPSLKKHMIDQKKEMIRELNDSSCSLTHSLLSEYNQRALSGELTLQDAQARAIKRIRNLRYGPEGENYFWIMGLQHKIIMHPYRIDLEGKDQTQLADSNGKHFLAEMVNAVKIKGSGYVEYQWQRKGDQTKTASKLSYVRLFEPWGWVIGTGISMDDVHSEITSITRRLVKLFTGILIFVLILSFYVINLTIGIEKKARQAEKAHRFDTLRFKKLRELNRMAETSLKELTEFTLEEAIELTQSRIGYLAFLNDDETLLTMQTWSKDALQECNIRNKEKTGPVEQTGLWGESVRQRKTVIINDYETSNSLHKKGYPEGHIKILRHMNVPVFDGGKIVAIAGVGNKNKDYDKSDARQLNLLLDGMWKIIQRKKSEAALRESEERYRLLAENAIDTVWILRLSDLRYLYVSPSVESFLGYLPEQMNDLQAKEYTTKDSLNKISMIFSEELEKENMPGIDPKRSRVIELEQIRKDGRTVWTEVRACFLRDETGKADRIHGVTRDITERRQMEQQLQQSQKMEAIGTLAGGIAHDFNNILSSVLGFTELAKMRCSGDSEIEKDLNQVLTAGIRARDLVRHILVFSRQQEVHRDSISIIPLIKECLKFIRASVPRSIEIVQDLNSSGCTVIADASQIHQVIMNLCTNAAHSMKGKNGLLEVCLKLVEIHDYEILQTKGLKPGRYFKLTVSDSGCGIPKPVVERIFEPFFTTKKRGEGTGMGLSIVHGIVKDMSGAISVYSEPDKGTTFHVFLPAHRVKSVEIPPSSFLLKKGTGRILLVDDEESIVTAGRQILTKMGYTVVGLTDSLDALDTFRKNPHKFDLILTDVTMPKMTGIELSKEILKIRKEIPIVLCTGFSEGLTSNIVENISTSDIVMKPMIASELAEVINKALKAKVH